MKNSDNFYIRKMKENIALRDRVAQFIKDWETLNTESMKTYIQEDADIDFCIFARGIDRETFLRKMAVRPKKATWTRFDLYNYVGLFEKGRAQITCEIVMEFVNDEDEPATEFNMVSNFVATLVSVGEYDWRFSVMKLNQQEDNRIKHPVLQTSGIPLIPDRGCVDFVSDWILHDDRIGWFPGKRMLTVLPEVDMPWNAIKNPEYIGSDEEQIERTVFAYYYGVDQILGTQFMDYTFGEDGMIIYNDGAPLDVRAEIEAMKTQIQGSPRVVHVAKVIDIQVDGDHAVAKTYNRMHSSPFFADPVQRETRTAWARYRITLTRRNGQWRIDRLNYYPAFFVAEEA